MCVGRDGVSWINNSNLKIADKKAMSTLVKDAIVNYYIAHRCKTLRFLVSYRAVTLKTVWFLAGDSLKY